MKAAIAEARMGIRAGHGGPFGAVIVKDGEIVAKAHNSVIRDNDPTCHGEMTAIRRACKKIGSFDLSGCEIYTTGAPCPMCMAAIRWANIGKVFYGCNTEDAARIGFRDQYFYETAREKIGVELDHADCLALYDEYRNMADKTPY